MRGEERRERGRGGREGAQEGERERGQEGGCRRERVREM